MDEIKLPRLKPRVFFEPQDPCEDCERLTADLVAARSEVERLTKFINHINDARGFSWHLQRRRENDRYEWFSCDAYSVFGPFPTALEAFDAVKNKYKPDLAANLESGHDEQGARK